MKGKDPLHGNVLVEQAGSFIIGIVRIRNPAAMELLDLLRERIGGRNK